LFAVIYDTSGRPVDRQALSRAGLTVESPTGAPQLVFIHSSETFDGEWRGCASLQGKYWIAGRVRLDARRDLAARLADRRVEPASLTDGALCLQAYAAWGDRCVEHLAGDFAFVLWDGERRRLLAARDQLGVRSLFHAQKGGVLVAGDSLDWIVTTPLTTGFIDRDHDEQWIADFLTAGFSLDVERTVYRHVRRLAPAHLLDVADGAVTTRRYWHLEIGEPLHLGSGRAYTERFLELMSYAVADRLPAGKVGISMSGGIDSTTLAACAIAATGDPSRVVAECTHFERLMPDDEASFATLAAERLGIELHVKAIDDFIYDPDWRSQRGGGAEPSPNIVARHPDRLMALEQARRAPIWFFGEGPDNALAFERGAYFSWLARRGEWLRLGQAALLYLKAKGIGGWGQTVRRYTGQGESSPVGPDLPGWLDRGLADRLDQGARLGRLGSSGGSSHPWHPQAVASFADPIWPALFDGFDSDETLAPMVWRHPYLDLRVIGFLLSVPPVPWAREKLLMREAMRGRLPDAVLARRKTPLAGAPLADLVATHGLPTLSDSPQLAGYVDTRALPREVPSGPAFERLINVFALDHWLTQQSGTAPIAGAWRGR
jgi:asparagine synthase (glutamine-hydrolysing)